MVHGMVSELIINSRRLRDGVLKLFQKCRDNREGIIHVILGRECLDGQIAAIT